MHSISEKEALADRFAIPGVAEIVEGNGSLPKIRITAAESAADIYLHGAHITSWRPKGFEEVLFLSERSLWEDGRAIRGGIPICFPWFRGKADDVKAPAHGVVRTKAWQLVSLTQEGESVTAVLSTESDEATRRWWPYEFRLLHRVTVGAGLKMELIVTNTGSTPLSFQEALHTYHRVGDVTKIQVTGLDGAVYLDNMDSNREKTQQGDVLFTRQVDNAYLNTQDALELIDPVLQRRIRTEKHNSRNTVVWNPWEGGARPLPDLGDGEWREMACVEACNLFELAVDLAPGQQHTMTATLKVKGNEG